MEKNNRIYWIDGLKGIACIMIFVHHLMVGFLPASYYGAEVMQHGNNGWDTFMSQNPIAVFVNGNFWVCVFCVLSGLVQSYKIFKMDSMDSLPKDMVKRYFRLSLPILCISLIVYLLMQKNCFFNLQANKIVQSPWLGSYYLEKKTLKDVFYTSFISVLFLGDSTFSNAFWMLQEIFLGSYLTYIIAMVGYKKRKKVLLIYCILGIIFWVIQSYMLTFVMGAFIAYMMVYMNEKIKYQEIIGIIEIVLGGFFGGYPTGVTPTNIYRLLNFQSYVVWHMLGAFLIVMGLYHCKIVQKILNKNILLMLGKKSFAIYLVHIPVIFSFSSWLFIVVYEKINRYQFSLMIVFGCTLAVVIVTAYIYQNAIEKKCEKLANIIVEKMYEN